MVSQEPLTEVKSEVAGEANVKSKVAGEDLSDGADGVLIEGSENGRSGEEPEFQEMRTVVFASQSCASDDDFVSPPLSFLARLQEDLVLKYGESMEDLKNMVAEFLRLIDPGKAIICADLEAKRMQISWRIRRIRRTDCGVYLMRHMETYVCQGISKWDCGLVRGDTTSPISTIPLQSTNHRGTTSEPHRPETPFSASASRQLETVTPRFLCSWLLLLDFTNPLHCSLSPASLSCSSSAFPFSLTISVRRPPYGSKSQTLLPQPSANRLVAQSALATNQSVSWESSRLTHRHRTPATDHTIEKSIGKLGKAGDTVKIALGFFRNHLMPKLLA
nr:zinc finger BED domain-containing protein RICESLEEPER 2-like [Ipomoea batatas]